MGRRLALRLLSEVLGHAQGIEASGPQLVGVDTTFVSADLLTVKMTFSHASGLHLNDTADCKYATDATKAPGTKGRCCELSPFLIRASDGSWTRTRVPVVAGDTVTVTAYVGNATTNATDVAYDFEAFPPCALYNAEHGSAAGPDSHDGLPAAPFRRALRDHCPLPTLRCAAAGVSPDLAQAQCCTRQSPRASSLEDCVAGMGCFGKYNKAPTDSP